MELLSSGNFAQGEQVFGSGFDAGPEPCGVCSVKEILFKAERTQPKPTQANPLYANFGKRREGEHLTHTHTHTLLAYCLSRNLMMLVVLGSL